MNTFKKYLQETKLPKLQNGDIKKIFNTLFKIADNIEPFVKAIGGPKNLSKQVLWRGIKKKNIKLIKTIRKDRRPKDTEKNVSKVVDNWFLKNFKSRFRSNAIFATGDLVFTANFGRIVAIIPKGNFSFVWSLKTRDLFDAKIFKFKTIISAASQFVPVDATDTEIFHNLSKLSLDEAIIEDSLKENNLPFDNKSIKKKAINSVEKDIQAGLDESKYQSNNLNRAISSGNEIMISGKEYYAITTNRGVFQNIKQQLSKKEFVHLLPKNYLNFRDEIFILKLVELILLGKITR